MYTTYILVVLVGGRNDFTLKGLASFQIILSTEKDYYLLDAYKGANIYPSIFIALVHSYFTIHFHIPLPLYFGIY